MRAVGPIVLFLASVIWSVPTGMAQTSGREPPCMQCHRPSDTTIDPAQFARSVHGILGCTVCHTKGVNQFPHTSSQAAMPDCIDCHRGWRSPIDFDKIAQRVKASVHVKMVDPAFRCTSCHSPHYFIPASRITDASEFIFVSNKSCLGCHAAGDTPAAKDLALGKLAEKHRWLFHSELHLQRTACVACHTPPGQQTVHLVLPKSEAVRDCTICHAKNSMLATKLYAHLALKERAEHGFVNAILFNNAYLTGANRNRWLDWGALGLAGLTLLGVAAHGLGRWAFAGFRRRRS